MAALTTVVDGNIKFREGKKWKNRWCVLKKPSPVADHLQLVLYKDVSEACKPGAKAKAVFTLDAFFGLEAEICVDKEQHVLAIICLKNVFLMAFELRESMIRFEIKIRQSLGEEHQFPVKVVRAPSNSKLPKDQLCLLIHDTRFCLTAQTPPKILMSWNVEDLRRFVAREDKFIFEGGTRCGKGSGLFAIQSEQADDIADIINLASSGKMSNCHRKFKNRRSQIELVSHLIAPLPSQSSSSQPHHHYNHHPQLRQQSQASKSPLQGTLPTTLNCCLENQTGSAESEDWSWYKRHSVSVTDHRRISALRDKNNMDNRDQIIMEIYDTPPNHDKEVGACTNEDPTYDHPNFNAQQSQPLSSPPPTSDYYNDDAMEGLYSKIERKGTHPGNGDGLLANTNNISLGGAQGVENVAVIEPHNELSSPPSCNETLQNLKKQEYMLQREMVLLDEMLKSCTTETKSLASAADNQTAGLRKIPVKDNISENSQPAATHCVMDGRIHGASYGLYDELPASASQMFSDTNKDVPDSSCAKDTSPALSISYQDFEIISGNISIMKPSLMSQSGISEKKKKPIPARLNTSLPEGTPLSPLFHAKLKSIPPSSKLNAPLPYVNLSGYDVEATNHVHLPGSADCIPLPVTRGSSFHSLNTSQHGDGENQSPWRVHTGSMTSLHVPAAVSSLTNLHQHDSHKRLQGRQSLESAVRPRNNQAHFMLKQAIEGPSFANATNMSRQEVLVVKMDPDVSRTESSLSSSMRSLSFDANESIKSKPDIVNLLTVDSAECSGVYGGAKEEEIYENLPFVKEDTPPPPLPPKGPALLKKLRASSMSLAKSEPRPKTPSVSSPPTPHRQNRSSTSNNNSNYGYDNPPKSDSSTVTVTKSCKMDTDGPHSNYFEMGSPETSHRHTKTVPKMTPRLPEQLKANKTLARVPRVRDDYMDMGVVDFPADEANCEEEDKIYLDVEETCKQSDLYISERELKEKREAREPQKKEASVRHKRESGVILKREASEPRKREASEPHKREALALPTTVAQDTKECTYVEMANAMPRKSMVLQNLETLQAYVSQKLGSEKALNVSQAGAAATASHPPLPRSLKIRHNSDSGPSKRSSVNLDSPSHSNTKPGKSPMRVYTKAKTLDSSPPSPNTEPPAPFTNLMEFAKKMGDGKSTYVNTSVNEDDNLVCHDFVPLPEPAKEGFLARLKRRSSKDKGVPVLERSGGSGKNRSSVLERSMSEHESPKSARKEEKPTKIKLGRRRSSSFPNRLSYQEANSDSNAPMAAQQGAESSSSFSSGSSKSKASDKKDQSESSSSVHDYSDDSDKSPLLKHGRVGAGSGTVLHVQQDQPFVKELFTSQSTSCLTSLSFDSSKTDDEKMIEIFQKQHSSHQANSSSDSLQVDQFVKSNEKKNKTHLNSSMEYPSVASRVENSISPQIMARSSMEDYCNMNAPPKNGHMPPVSLCVGAGVDNLLPPALPPKNRSYQALLSPVLESAPPLPLGRHGLYNSTGEAKTNTSSETWECGKEIEEDSSDQYVELKGATDEEQLFSRFNTSVNSKAGRESIPSTSSSSDPKEINPQCVEYTTISLPLAQRLNQTDDCREVDHETVSSPKSSPVLMANSIRVEQNSISSDLNVVTDDCITPAKSVLRPRSGREYVVIKRIPTPESSCPPSASLPSQSPSLSQVFNYELHLDQCLHLDQSRCHHNHHHSHPVSSCTSLSLCSRLSAHHTPQRSPSLSSTVGIAQSHVSLTHESWEKENGQQGSHASNLQKPSTHSSVTTTPMSPSPSPQTPLLGLALHPSPKTNKNGNLCQQSALPEEDSIFFPSDVTSNASSPLPQSARRASECQPIYVNQQFVDMHYFESHSSGSRTISTCSSLSNPSPLRAHIQSHHGPPRTSFPSSKQNSQSNSLGRNVRVRLRNSESDALSRGDKHSKSFSLPSNHHRPSLTLPASVYRSHSDPKRAENVEQRQTVSQSHIHGKEFDKFAKSSIIARRRLKHAGSALHSGCAGNGESSPPGPSVSASEPSLSLQISSSRSSGYKNIDRFYMAGAVESPLSAAAAPNLTVCPGSHADNIVESQTSFDHKLCSLHNEHLISNSPPPLPIRQRLVSTPSTVSPPLTPFMASSDISDSPPPYNAPPPPGCRYETISSSSSEDEQELNYIEVDMSKLPCEVEQPALPISISRRNKRGRQQRKLAKLRYAEIDHTATKALQHTGQEHAQTRRGGILPKSGTSLSRMNSAPVSNSRKPLAVRERTHSSCSVDSF